MSSVSKARPSNTGPSGAIFGKMQYILLAGAIEKGDKIPKSDVETAIRRLANASRDREHVTFHQYDGEEPLEENGG